MFCFCYNITVRKVIKVDRYKFDERDSEIIVNAMVEGYRDYIDHRKDRNEKMVISSAFAWTKENFIESRIANDSLKLNMTYQRAKAGLTWEYLQFRQDDTKKLFLIKNAAYFNEKAFSHAVLPNKNNSPRRTYLHELSKINLKLDFPNYELNLDSVEEDVQLSFFVVESKIKEELEQIQSSFNEFHIITYELDEAYQISKVMHYLPNPTNNIAYKVEDLSRYISGAELTDEERDIIAPEQSHDILDPVEFDIGIFEEEEKK